ncbi:MAG: amidohydrolase family protein [Gemmatimonadales bacterium]|nr:amidohydrolase family protein [Gemmatimonadales bacterium]
MVRPSLIRAAGALALTVLLPAAAWAQAAGARADLAITHTTVIDVATGNRLPNRTILVTGNRVRTVGPAGTGALPRGVRVIDGSGKFVIPGLWDMHVHTIRHDLDFPLELANGVTGVRDMGGSTQYPPPGNWGILFDSLRTWRAAIRAGTMLGPRIVAGGVALDGPKPRWPQTLSIATPAAARRVVDSLRAVGVDFIKVYGALPKEILRAIAEQTRAAGLPFAGHLPSGVTLEEAADLGQRSVEHVNAFDESGFDPAVMAAGKPLAEVFATFDSTRLARESQALARRPVWSDPTLVAYRSLTYPIDSVGSDTARIAVYTPTQVRQVWSDRLAGMHQRRPTSEWIQYQQFWEHDVRAARRAGVKLLVGSDAWNPNVMPGFGLHREMELLVGQGYSPGAVLRAATLGAAEYLGATDSLGTVAAGKLADLVVLEADPVADIRNVRRIHAVVVDGRLLDRRELDRLLAQARASARR